MTLIKVTHKRLSVLMGLICRVYFVLQQHVLHIDFSCRIAVFQIGGDAKSSEFNADCLSTMAFVTAMLKTADQVLHRQQLFQQPAVLQRFYDSYLATAAAQQALIYQRVAMATACNQAAAAAVLQAPKSSRTAVEPLSRPPTTKHVAPTSPATTSDFAPPKLQHVRKPSPVKKPVIWSPAADVENNNNNNNNNVTSTTTTRRLSKRNKSLEYNRCHR
jgi:hypothetical protein